MPARSDDPLRRVTLNLYEADCLHLERTQGSGWTTHIRNMVHTACNESRKVEHALRIANPPRTLGDLDND